MLSVLLVAAGLISEEPAVVSTAPRDRADALLLQGEATAPAMDAEAPRATVTLQDLTTAEQIDRWIAARDPSARPFADEGAPGPAETRRVHGEVSAAIGTGGYNAVDAAVTIPLGETGFVHLRYGQSRNGYGYYGHGPDGWGPYGLSPYDSGWRRARPFAEARGF